MSVLIDDSKLQVLHGTAEGIAQHDKLNHGKNHRNKISIGLRLKHRNSRSTIAHVRRINTPDYSRGMTGTYWGASCTSSRSCLPVRIGGISGFPAGDRPLIPCIVSDLSDFRLYRGAQMGIYTEKMLPGSKSAHTFP